MPVTNEVEELLQVIGPFYELVDEKRKITQVSDLSTGKLTNSALSSCSSHLCSFRVFYVFEFKSNAAKLAILLLNRMSTS